MPSRCLLIVPLVLIAGLLGITSAHAACPPVKSKGITCDMYEKPPPSFLADGRESVVLFFMYICPKCGPLDKATRDWGEKVRGIGVHRWHVGWQGDELARVHFALQKHKLSGTLSQELFEAVQGRRYKGPDDVVAWANASKFPSLATGLKETINSQDAFDYVSAVDQTAKAFQIMQVPCFIVNGKYRIVVKDAEPDTIAELEPLITTLQAEG